MSLGDDIRAVAERADRDLNAAHDYFEHSRLVWRFFESSPGAEEHPAYTNRATSTTVTRDDLVQLSQNYTREYLTVFTFQKFVSLFEGFVFDLLRLVLVHNPRQLAKKQVEFSAILNAADRDQVILAVVNKELNELKYERPREWFEYPNRTVRLDCPTAEEVEAVAEIKASRDVLEHNAGVANAIYLGKAGRRARYQPGEQLEIPDAYFRESWELLKKVIRDLSGAAIARFSPGNSRLT